MTEPAPNDLDSPTRSLHFDDPLVADPPPLPEPVDDDQLPEPPEAPWGGLS